VRSFSSSFLHGNEVTRGKAAHAAAATLELLDEKKSPWVRHVVRRLYAAESRVMTAWLRTGPS
jgi:hypothetical protein